MTDGLGYGQLINLRMVQRFEQEVDYTTIHFKDGDKLAVVDTVEEITQYVKEEGGAFHEQGESIGTRDDVINKH